jgi:ZIP family zinc transporter
VSETALTGFGLGLLGASALLLGAVLSLRFRWSQSAVAAVMAFGAGGLIASLAFELVAEAHEAVGVGPVAVGFLAGAAIFVVANEAVNNCGGSFRKLSILRRFPHHAHGPTRRADGEPASEPRPMPNFAAGTSRITASSAGLAIFLGSLLDSIPESVVIGASQSEHASFNLVFVAAVFLSNLPEGLTSSVSMRRSGYSPARICGLWGLVVVGAGIAALVGNVALSTAPAWLIGGTEALAAGAILAMLADTMMPEAYEEGGPVVALWTAAGFLAPFLLKAWLQTA